MPASFTPASVTRGYTACIHGLPTTCSGRQKWNVRNTCCAVLRAGSSPSEPAVSKFSVRRPCGLNHLWMMLLPRRQRWHHSAPWIPQPHRYRRAAHLKVSPAVPNARVNDEEQRCRTFAVGQRGTGQCALATQVVSKPLHEGPPISAWGELGNAPITKVHCRTGSSQETKLNSVAFMRLPVSG